MTEVCVSYNSEKIGLPIENDNSTEVSEKIRILAQKVEKVLIQYDKKYLPTDEARDCLRYILSYFSFGEYQKEIMRKTLD